MTLSNKIPGLKLISIDLFRTLVDLDQTPKIIWETFLRDHYPPDVAQRHWLRAAEILDRIWDDAGTDKGPTVILERSCNPRTEVRGEESGGVGCFKNIRQLLEETCSQLFKEIESDLNLESAVALLMQKHRIHRLFDDARPFLEAAGRTYPVCLSTDCDLEMLEEVNNLYPFQNIFDSESLKAYKLNPAFFKHVIRHSGLNPDQILHIGDSKSDIIAPAQLGLQTCWLSRGHQPWTYPVKPDFEVQSLTQVLDLLGINR